MSSCQVCGRYDADDDATGYSAADICPDCAEEGFVLTADGRIVNEHNEDADENSSGTEIDL